MPRVRQNEDPERQQLMEECCRDESKKTCCSGCCRTLLASTFLILALGTTFMWFTWHRGCWEKPQLTWEGWYLQCWPEPETGLAGAHAALAMSWHTDPDAPYLVSPGIQLFEYEDEEMNRVSVPTAVSETKVSDSYEMYAKSISASIGIEVEARPYGVEAAAHASASAVWGTSSSTYRFDQYVKAKKMRISRNTLDAHEHLTDSARRFLLEAKPNRIEATLGQFYPTSVTLGGVYQLTMMTERRSSDSFKSIAANMSGSYKKFAFKAKGSLSGAAASTHVEGDRSYHLKMRVLGGDTTPWLGLQSNNYDSIQGEWVQTITEENMYPVGVRLRPLWELLDHADMDPAKAEELKNYMMRPRN